MKKIVRGVPQEIAVFTGMTVWGCGGGTCFHGDDGVGVWGMYRSGTRDDGVGVQAVDSCFLMKEHYTHLRYPLIKTTMTNHDYDTTKAIKMVKSAPKSISYNVLIFDIDGTLWDAVPTSAHAWTQWLTNLGINRTIYTEDIRAVIWKSQDESIRQIIGETNIPFETCYYELDTREREYIERDGGTLYPNVIEGLHALSNHFTLGLVSNCTDWYLRNFRRYLLCNDIITDALSWGDTQRPKSENIRTIIERNEWKNVAYIGDTETDEQSAQQAGVDFYGVSYGFGTPNGIQNFKSFDELVVYFMKA